MITMSRPNVFIIGSTKCATTSMYMNLGNHKEVAVGIEKESLFFMRDYHERADGLAKRFPRTNKVVLDAHPSNCMFRWVADRIEETCDNPKIILSVRDPIKRAYSEICHFKKMRPGRLIGTPDQIISENFDTYDRDKFPDERSYMMQADPRGGCYEHAFLERGCYISHIERFKKLDTKVVFFEDYIKDHQKVLDELTDFIGISRFTGYANKINSKSDDSFFSKETVERMRQFYAFHNRKLSEYVGFDVTEKFGVCK